MTTFTETGLSAEILRAIGELGFETPTPIQAKTIPHLLESDRDLVAFAQTGTGKTAAFGLPLLQKVEIADGTIQALVLCPTRELCLQISRDLANFAKYTPGLRTVAVYGGAAIDRQIRELREGAHIVIGTPGRVRDLMGRKKLKIEHIRTLVLDEADEMLSMGFKEELDEILVSTPEEKQTLLFSATMPSEIARIAENYLHEPVEISAGKRNTSAANVEHLYYQVRQAQRYEALRRFADANPGIYAIIFCRTRQEANDIAGDLMRDGYNADALHGDLSQPQRDLVMERFRRRQTAILVATDVAARGLDVDSLTHVINYNLPDDPEVYIHRSGRTGRAGRSGVSVAFITSREIRKLKMIEQKMGRAFELKKVPSGREVCECQALNYASRVCEATPANDILDTIMPAVLEQFEGLNREELMRRMISLECGRIFEASRDAHDLNDSYMPADRRRSSAPSGRSREGATMPGFTRISLNLGRERGVDVRSLLSFINRSMSGQSFRMGKVEIGKQTTFVEIERGHEKAVMSALNKAEYRGVRLEAKAASPRGGARRSA